MQVYNPFLPLHEYIPDGEPHVFGDRVYHYGSHDREGGSTFCMEDYVVYSAPVDDLTKWRYEGVSYRASQDPTYPNPQYMYAPDVVQGNDGRYYLYYCMGGDYGYGGYQGPIRVAVANQPAGPYEYYGVVSNPDGTPMMKYICFDPAALNDNGAIRIYYGTQYDYEEREDFGENDALLQDEINMFGRSKEEILSYPDSIMGPSMVVLCDDMLTVKEEAKHIIPYRVKGTSFEGHPFFEGASMRKVGEKYYFVYSSWQNHELCYAVSDYPDHGFTFGGTIVSNGDVGLNGRNDKDKVNMTGTTHGSIVEINGQWYVFFHRLTHKSDYSRQACAEPIQIAEDGSIKQVEVTSCGLNGGPLKAEGRFPAVIACNLTNGHMPHGSNSIYQEEFPNVTHAGDERFIAEIEEGTLIGYKYFRVKEGSRLGVRARIETERNKVVYTGPIRLDERCAEDKKDMEAREKTAGEAVDARSEITDMSSEVTGANFEAAGASLETGEVCLEICTEEAGTCIGRIRIPVRKDGMLCETWEDYVSDVALPAGTYGIFLYYRGEVKLQMKEIFFA